MPTIGDLLNRNNCATDATEAQRTQNSFWEQHSRPEPSMRLSKKESRVSVSSVSLWLISLMFLSFSMK